MARYATTTPAARGTPLLGRPMGSNLQPFTRTTYRPQPYGGAIGQIGAQQRSARQANIQRRKQIESLYGEMLGMVQPGGAFERRGLADIERQKTRGVGRETQRMISGGMYGTTTAAGVGRRWEADVAGPQRLRLEDIMQRRQLGVMGQKAGFLERIEDEYPEYSQLLQLLAR